MNDLEDLDPPAEIVRAVPVWEPLAGEPSQAYQAFEAYLLSDTSLPAHADRVGRSLATLQAWAARWRWRARRAAYQAHLRAHAQAAALDEVEEIAREHARGLALMRQIGTEALERALANPGLISPRDAAFLLKTAIDGERLLAGQATARTEVKAEGMSLAQLDALHALMSGDADAAREALAIDASPEGGG